MSAESARSLFANKPAILTLNQATEPDDLFGFLLSFEVSGLWFEEGQAIGSFFCSIGKLKCHLFCTA